MLKKIVSMFILFTGIFSLSHSQNTVGLQKHEVGVTPGYSLFSAHTKSFLINNCGQVVNEWQSQFRPGNAVYLLENGNLLRASREDGKSNIIFGGQGGVVELFNWEGQLIWSVSFNDDQKRQHHDVYPMPNGNILVLLAETWLKEDVITAGRNPDSFTADRIYNERIIEIKPVGTNDYELIWEWSVNDHLIQDVDASKPNFGIIKDNPQRLNINYLNGNLGEAWLHVNSLQYNAKFDQIIIGTRNLSEFWVIDHSTTIEESKGITGGKYGKGGDFLYRWGNPESYDMGNESDRILYGQHSPNFIEKNNVFTNDVILFNNGRDRDPDFSEVLKIKLPVDENGFYSRTPNTKFLPEEPFFNYSDLSQNPSEFYSSILSSAQVLPNNNILICEGIKGNFIEINENKQIVWKYKNPINNINGTIYNQGETPTQNTNFRVKKYPLDYPAFIGRDLTASSTIETGTDIASCQSSLSIENENETTVEIYPNPTKNGKIFFSKKIDYEKLEIYTSQGKLIYKTRKKVDEISLKDYSFGIYFIKFSMQNSVFTKKIIYN